MKKHMYSILTLLLVVGMCFVAWNIVYTSGTWRYKMTVEVETPEGIKTGSAVREIYSRKRPALFGEMHNGGLTALAKGEAVVVDLGARGVLFGLLNGPKVNGVSVVRYAFPCEKCLGGNGVTTKESILYYRGLKSAHAVLTLDLYPQFVRFRSLSDPKTVENLLDFKSCGLRDICLEKDHFEEAFGQGVKLKSVTIEMTEERVSFSMDRYLSWLPMKKGVAGVIGSTKDAILYKGSLGLTGVEFSKGQFW